jgi:pyruvate carboxylase subunit B
MRYIVTADEGQEHEVTIERAGEIVVNGKLHRVDLQPIDDGAIHSLLLDDRSFEVFVERREGVYYVLTGGNRYALNVDDEHMRAVRSLSSEPHQAHGETVVSAPMPGLVVQVMVEVGQDITAGQGLMILEAMKMENEIRTPREGRVKAVMVKQGDAVTQGQHMLVVEG